ncbi:MAG: hypothetical protein KTR14_08170 [Vampirovibrio sp.]|nr:hypothetical protein [Vampirovibrio sp.]
MYVTSIQQLQDEMKRMKAEAADVKRWEGTPVLPTPGQRILRHLEDRFEKVKEEVKEYEEKRIAALQEDIEQKSIEMAALAEKYDAAMTRAQEFYSRIRKPESVDEIAKIQSAIRDYEKFSGQASALFSQYMQTISAKLSRILDMM